MTILFITYQWTFYLREVNRDLQKSIPTSECISVNDTIHIQYTETR